MKKVFVVGGSPAARRPNRLRPEAGDRVLAADRGAEHARAWGWPVHLIVGDLDSLPSRVREAEARAGTPLVRVPVAKDLTDMELALQYALEEGPAQIVLCGALGGRTDHLLANVFLLGRPDLAERDVCLADGNETLYVLHSAADTGSPRELALKGRPGDLLTLLPLHGDAVGITTHDLRYPLRDETLHAGEARGTSNVFEAGQVAVILRLGTLLVAHIAQE